MFNSAVLEVTIGVLVVFLMVSTTCTAIREGIEAILKTRAAYLEAGIREFLGDIGGKGAAQAFFNHPLIFSLYAGNYVPGAATRKTLESGRNLPSYISGRSVALALLDIAARGQNSNAPNTDQDLPPITFATVRQNVGRLGNPHLEQLLRLALDSAEGDIERARQNLHTWFDESMARVSGWYKRSTQAVLFVIALVVVGTLNINTIAIAQYLYRNDLARAQVVETAEERIQAGKDSPQNSTATQLLGLELPLGWEHGYGAPVAKPWSNIGKDFNPWNDVVGTVAGLLITVFAAMLGAPFWFDLLSRITSIRSTFKPPTASPADAVGATAAPPSVLVVRTEIGERPPAPDDGEICDHAKGVRADELTSDEDLPAARGGVELQ